MAASVDLRGTTRARATPSRGPAIAGLEEAVVDEPVEAVDPEDLGPLMRIAFTGWAGIGSEAGCCG